LDLSRAIGGFGVTVEQVAQGRPRAARPLRAPMTMAKRYVVARSLSMSHDGKGCCAVSQGKTTPLSVCDRFLPKKASKITADTVVIAAPVPGAVLLHCGTAPAA